MKTLTIGDKTVQKCSMGTGAPLVLIAGPCVIESKDLCFEVAAYLKDLTHKLGIGFVFKASFDKANRSSIDSFRGPGLDAGLDILAQLRKEFAVPVVSDIHLPDQAAPAAEVLDILQIPALLCRQTDLIEAAAKTGKCVQIKKGQFMSPHDMKNVIDKITHHGNQNIILVERGSTFGYNRLVCDITAIPQMRQLGYPVVIDATHATQQPTGQGKTSGGDPAQAQTIAKAALAAGADALFLETHPNPKKALSDGPAMTPLNQLPPLLKTCRDIHQLLQQQR